MCCSICAVELLLFLAGCAARIADASSSEGERGPEHAQDIVSCLYLLLQSFGDNLAVQDNPNAQTALGQVRDAMLSILKVQLSAPHEGHKRI